MIRENDGFEMFKMIEVEKYPCNDRREPEKKEDELMKESKATMNKIKSFRTEEDKIPYKEEYNKKIKEQRKQNNENKINLCKLALVASEYDCRLHHDNHRAGRKDGGIQRRLEVRRPEDLTPLFAACLLTRTLCWLHA